MNSQQIHRKLDEMLIQNCCPESLECEALSVDGHYIGLITADNIGAVRDFILDVEDNHSSPVFSITIK